MEIEYPKTAQSILEKIFRLLLYIFPLVILPVGRVGGIIFFLISLVAVLIVANDIYNNDFHFYFTGKIKVFGLMFLSAIFATLIPQILRLHIKISDFDSPFRLMLALPIFMVVYYKKIRADLIITKSLPLALILIVFTVYYLPNMTRGGDRITLYSLDQLTFGSLTLLFGMLCVSNIVSDNIQSFWQWIVNILGGALGVALSLGSQSRTGWLAVPFILLYCLWTLVGKSSHKVIFRIVIISFTSIISLATYLWVPIVNDRINDAICEFSGHTWNAERDKFTSIGERLNYWYIGYILFKTNPVCGTSQSELNTQLSKDEFKKIAHPETLSGLKHVGFHNEFMTATVAQGVWGAVSRLLIVIIPAGLIIQGCRSRECIINKQTVISATYLIMIV